VSKEDPKLFDWLGHPLEIGTMVIWKKGATTSAEWKIGAIVGFRKPEYGPWVLDIDWTQSSGRWFSGSSKKGRGVLPGNVTSLRCVWGAPVGPHDEYKEV
jgi:hypothetical protein